MKFLGASQNDPMGTGDAARALDKLLSQKFEKYLKADAKIDVPSDQYDQMVDRANIKLKELSQQLENQKASNNLEQVKKLQNKIEKLEKIKRNLREKVLYQVMKLYLPVCIRGYRLQ